MPFRSLVVVSIVALLCEARIPRLIYSQAPENEVQNAYGAGVMARDQYLKEVEGETDDMKRFELFAKYLLTCSAVASDYHHFLDQKIGDLAEQAGAMNPRRVRSRQILEMLGFEPVTARLLTSPIKDIQDTIQIACLKNELQFQCAGGFMRNLSKLEEHIADLKRSDGNLKVMFERECRTSQSLPQIYGCIGSTILKAQGHCRQEFSVFGQARLELSRRIREVFDAAKSRVDSLLAETTDDPEVVRRLLEVANADMSSTLAEVRSLEDVECEQFRQAESCLFEAMNSGCGEEVLPVMRTVLRVGRLARERGADLHSQFELFEMAPSPNCQPYI